MKSWQYLWIKADDNFVFREVWPESQGRKALLFSFLNEPDKNGKGIDASSVRVHVRYEYDTGVPGPNFSPVPWFGEELAFVAIPLGVEKKIVFGVGAGPQQGWYGYKSNRINSSWAKGANPLESNPVPDRGKMRVQVIASINGQSEVVWTACFSWKVDFYSNHPWFEQIDCKEMKVV